MKAMILAAGLGTRLKPFTNAHPKALYVVNGKTLLEHSLEHLKTAGISEVIINVHHFASQIIDYLAQHDQFGMQFSFSDESVELLETGGGVKMAAWFFHDCETAIIRNVDIISDLDIMKFSAYHETTGSLATLAIRKRETSRYFLFDDSMKMCGWENRKTGERVIAREPAPGNPNPIMASGCLTPYAFSGIQVINTEIFQLISEEGKFSLTDLYLRLAKDHQISGYIEEGLFWRDAGRHDE